MRENYYKSSGSFSIMSIVLFIVLCLTVFPLLGALYAYAIWYIPIIYINFIVTGAFAFAIGLIISKVVLKIGKVRNQTLGLVFGILGTLVTLYFHWAVWADLAINVSETYGNSRVGIAVSNVEFEQVLYLITHPGALWNMIWEINEYGTWGIRTLTVNGIFLTIIWIIEFVGILLIAVFVAIPQAAKPFCEKEGIWFEEKVLPPFSFVTEEEKEKFVNKLEKLDITALDSFEKVEDSKKDSHSIFTLYSSKAGENYLSVENKLAKKNKKGEIEFEDDEFLTYVKINRDIVNKLNTI